MKLCVLANLYGDKTLAETLDRLAGLGVEAAEIGAGGYPGKAHCDPAVLLNDEKALAETKALIKKLKLSDFVDVRTYSSIASSSSPFSAVLKISNIARSS